MSGAQSSHGGWRLALRRLWQPRRGAFWLMVVANALSSAMAWTLHALRPEGLLLLLLLLLALANAALGLWAAAELVRPPPGSAAPPRDRDRGRD